MSPENRGASADRPEPHDGGNSLSSSLQSRLAYEAKCIEHDVSSRAVHAILLEASDEVGRLLLALRLTVAALEGKPCRQQALDDAKAILLSEDVTK